MSEEEAVAAAPAEAEAAAATKGEEASLDRAPTDAEGGADGAAAVAGVPGDVDGGESGESGAGTQTDQPDPAAAASDDGEAGEEDGDDGSPPVDATFVIMPENFQHAMQLRAGMTGADVKLAVAGELPLPVATLSLKFKGEPLSDEMRLTDVGISPGNAVQLELVVEYKQHKQSQAKVGANVIPGQMPDSIDVELPPLETTSQPRILNIPIDVSQAGGELACL
jgi:hypothetical protein